MIYRIINKQTGVARDITRVDAHRWAQAAGYRFRDLERQARCEWPPLQADSTFERLEFINEYEKQ